MTQTNNFFHTNIRFLRQKKNLTQEDAAQLLEMQRLKLQKLESGSTKSLFPDDLIKFSEFYKVSVDTLMKVDLAKLGALKLKDLQAGNDVYMTGTGIRVLAITVSSENKENVEYVPVKAKAGYKAGYNDPEFISTLPRYSFPALLKNNSYRMFPTIGDSMLPIPEGSDVLAKYVQDWTKIKAGTLCIVILKGEQDFLFKKVTILPDNNVQLASLNELYEPFIEPVSNILEMWEYDRFISKQIPALPSGELQDIKSMITRLRQDILGKEKQNMK